MENNHQYIAELVENQMWDKCYDEVTKGLKQNYKDYELYFALGEYYLTKNINQAYLCYENALFYCDNETDREYIMTVMKEIEDKGVNVKHYSIIIISYNSSDEIKECINSIRGTTNIYQNELIIIDNNSSGDIGEWIELSDNITLIQNDDNKGLASSLNRGIKEADAHNDIVILKSDTVITPNSLFWMRMGLYENKNVGAAGCTSNYVAGQRILEQYDTLDKYIEYGIRNNIPDRNAYEKKVWISDSAIIIKRKALDDIGLFDIRYEKGYYEDNDICVRLQYAGYQCLLCHNSFVFQWGLPKCNEYKSTDVMELQRNTFKEKWGFDIDYYSYSRDDIISFIQEDRKQAINVLEIGCGCGATLSKIKYLWPDADVKGIELVDNISRIGMNNYDIVQGNIENMNLNYEKQYFDYVIFGDVLEHLYQPEKTLLKLKDYMKKDAKIIISIPNIMNVTVLLPLLKGEFHYRESGVLDRTHIRFFTLKSAFEMISQCGFVIEDYGIVTNEALGINISDDEKQEFANALSNITGVADSSQFNAYQYIIRAKKI